MFKRQFASRKHVSLKGAVVTSFCPDPLLSRPNQGLYWTPIYAACRKCIRTLLRPHADADSSAPMSTGDAAAAAVAAADAREAAERARAGGADTTRATPPDPPPVNADELHHGTTWKTTAGPGEPSRVSDDIASGAGAREARAAALMGSGSAVMTPAIAAELKQRVRFRSSQTC